MEKTPNVADVNNRLEDEVACLKEDMRAFKNTMMKELEKLKEKEKVEDKQPAKMKDEMIDQRKTKSINIDRLIHCQFDC